MRCHTNAPVSVARLTHLPTPLMTPRSFLPQVVGVSPAPAVHIPHNHHAALLRHLRPESRPCRPVPSTREPHIRQHRRRGTLTLKVPLPVSLQGIPLHLPFPLPVPLAKQNPSQLWTYLRICYPQKVTSWPSRHASHHRDGVRRG